MKRGLFVGLAAAVAAGFIMLLFRLAFGAPIVPEVLIDWVTSLMPLGLFLLAVEAFGNWAKPLLVIVLSVILVAAGGGAGMLWSWLQVRWPWTGTSGKWWAGTALGLLLWLLAMVVVLPISGRGFFAVLIQPWPTAMTLGWLASFLTYALLLAGLSYRRRVSTYMPEGISDTTRRLLIKRLTYIIGGLVVVGGVGGGIWKLVSSLARRAIPAAMGELTPEVTPNEDFYTVSKNFIDPVVNAESWKLEVIGLVERNLIFDYEQLKALPAATQYLTLECISNNVGGSFIGNALWKGVRLQEILSRAGVKNLVRKVILYGDDDYTDSITLDKAMEVGTLLAYEMNGVPLSDEHGFPARLLVPGIYGMKNVKWLTKIELVDYDYRGYWQERDWSDKAVIKTMSRIDVPLPRADYTPDELGSVGGIAFSGDEGISWVEVSTDDGQTWSQAQVKGALSPYTWVLWVYNWEPTVEGRYSIKVRATDGKGNLQTSQQSPALPSGATGYHSIVVNVVRE
ncbi:MAG: molybdopterin-dependent oxidoreductase [Dehalococcoidales bacterium]